MRTGEVGSDIAPGPQLSTGKIEGQIPRGGPGLGPIAGDRDPGRLAQARTPQCEAQLEQIQLLEHEPLMSGRGGGHQAFDVAIEFRRMQGTQRFGRTGKLALDDETLRQKAGDQIRVLGHRDLHGATQGPRVDAFGSRVLGYDAPRHLCVTVRLRFIGRLENVDLWMLQLLREAVSLHVAGDQQQRSVFTVF